MTTSTIQSGDQLLDAIRQFLGAETLSECREIVDNHPELLSEDVEGPLRWLQGEYQGVEGAERIIAHRRHLLHACREVGIEKAFADEATASSMLAMLKECAQEQGPDAVQELEALPTDLMQQLASAQTLTELDRLARDHPDLRSALHTLGLDRTREMAVVASMIEFLQATSPEEARRIIDASPELMSDECDVLLTEMIHQAQADDYVRYIEERRDLLRRFRDLGPDAALSETVGFRLDASTAPPQLLSIMQGDADANEKRRRAVQSLLDNPEMLSQVEAWLSEDPAGAAAFALIEVNSTTELVRAVVEHPILMEKGVVGLIESTFAAGALHDTDGDMLVEMIEPHFRALQWMRGLCLQSDQLAVLADITSRGLMLDEAFLDAAAEHKEHRMAMEVIALVGSPLPAVACRVFDGELSMEDALKQITRHEVLSEVDPAEIRALDAYVVDLLKTYPLLAKQAHLLAELNLSVAQLTAEPSAVAESLETLVRTIDDRVERFPHDHDVPLYFERAIWASQRAVDIWHGLGDREREARARVTVGQAYHKSQVGDRVHNLKEAIAAYIQSAGYFSPGSAPTEYAMIQNYLGHAHSELPEGSRAENLNEAIFHYSEALQHASPASDLETYLTAHTGLGGAYLELPGARYENLDRAISCFREASRYCSPSSLARHYVVTHVGLGMAYLMLPAGDREWNVREAVNCFEKALDVCTQERFPHDFAVVQLNLSYAYATLSEGDREAHLGRALFCCRAAERVLTRSTFPAEYSRLQCNRGAINNDLAEITGKAEYAREAVSCLRRALPVQKAQHELFQYAGTCNNLGIAYQLLARLHDGSDYLLQSVRYFEESLGTFTPEAAPLHCRRTAENLGRLYFQHGDRLGLTPRQRWERSYRALALATEAARSLYRSGWTARGKEIERDEALALSRSVVTACLRLAKACPIEADHWNTEALVRAEEGKARRFLDQLAQADYPPPVGVNARLLAKEQTLLARTRELELSEIDSAAPRAAVSLDTLITPELLERRRRLHADLEEVWTRIANCGPAANDYVQMRQGEPLTRDGLLRLANTLGPTAALVAFYIGMEDITVFVLRAPMSSPSIYSVPLTYRELYSQYALNYQDEVLNRVPHQRTGRQATGEWQQLGERLLRPLLDQLTDTLSEVELLYLIPHGILHLLPLHALIVDGATPLDRWAIAYAPSAGALARVLERPQQQGGSAVVLGYTPADISTQMGKNERKLVIGEAKEVARHLRTSAFLDGSATSEVLAKQGSAATILHLSCHGSYDASHPLSSGVELADGSIDVLDWMRLRLSADLVTLSACETGMASVSAGDELVGLTRAVLYAGASSVLVSLWPVHAGATKELMIDFYQRGWTADLSKRAAKATALREAVLAMKRRHPDPYYWAPFALTGDWR